MPHPHEPARRATGRSCSTGVTAAHGGGTADECSAASSPGMLGDPARAHPAATRRTSTPTSGSPRRSFAPTARRLGRGQPHLLVAGGRARAGAAPGEPRLPGGDVNPYLALAGMLAGGLHGIEQRAAARAGRSRATPTPPTAERAHHAARGPRPVRRPATSRGEASATTSSTTTSTWPTSSWRAFEAAVTDWERSGGSSGCDGRLVESLTTVAQPGHRGGRRHRRAARRRGDRRGDRPGGRPPLPGVARGGARPTAAGCCAASPTSSTPTSRSWRARGRELRAHHRQRPLGGGQRPRRARLLRGGAGAAVRPADPGGRRRRRHLPRDRWASSASSCRGTSRCRSPAGASRPALAAGNTVVLKPAELDAADRASGSASSALEAGLPEDVFQVLPGKGSVVGRAVRRPPRRPQDRVHRLDRGRHAVMAGCAAQVKRVTLELGGKSANIVFADADLEKAAATAPYGVFDNAGQDCCARTRILVQRSVYDRFMELLEPAVRASWSGTRAPRTPRWARWSRADAARPGGVVRRGRRRAGHVAFRGSAPDGPGLLVPADRVLPRVAAPTGSGRGDLRPGRRRAAVRRRGRRHRAGQRHRRTGCPARSGPATWAGRCGSRAASRPATCRSTRTRRCATRRRSAASSSPGSAASSAPTRSTPSPRPRTSSSHD